MKIPVFVQKDVAGNIANASWSESRQTEAKRGNDSGVWQTSEVVIGNCQRE